MARPARAQGRTKVTFAWPFAVTSQAFQEELARRFMDAHKSIEVEVQIIPQTQAVPKLTAAFTGGAAPDCLALSHQLYVALAAQGHGRDGTHALQLALAQLSNVDWKNR